MTFPATRRVGAGGIAVYILNDLHQAAVAEIKDVLRSVGRVHVTGGFGSGRTVALKRVAGWGRQRGWDVLDLHPSDAMHDEPFGALRHAAHDTSASKGTPLQNMSVIDRADELARSLSSALVIVDDAHLLDNATAHMLERLVELNHTRLVVSTPNDVETPTWLASLTSSLEDEFVLTMLDRPTSHALAAHIVGTELDPWSSRRLFDRSSGSPLLMAALLRQAEREGLIDLTGPTAALTGDPALPVLLQRSILARRNASEPDDQLIIDLLGFVPKLPVATLDALVAPSCLTRLEKRRLLVTADHRYATLGRSSLVAPAATDVGPFRRRELGHLLLDHLGEDPTDDMSRLAVGLAQAALGRPIRDLEHVARHLESIGQDDELIEICHRTHDGRPSSMAFRVIAEAHLRQGRYDDADKAFAEALDATDDETERYTLFRDRAEARDHLHQTAEDVAEVLREGARDLSATDLSRDLTRHLALVNAFDGTWPSVREAAEHALTDDGIDQRTRVDLCAILCTARLLAGPLDGLADRMVDELNRVAGLESLSTRALYWLFAYDLAGAYEGEITSRLASMRTTAANLGASGSDMTGWATLGAAQVALLAGETKTAYLEFHSATIHLRDFDPMRALGTAIGLEALAAAMAGDARAASLLLLEYDDDYRGRPSTSPLPAERARAASMALAGDIDGACTKLAAAAAAESARSPVWAAFAYSDLTRMGQPCPDELEAIAKVVGGRLIPALAGHARALAERSEADLLDCADRLEELGAFLDAAEATAQSGEIHREKNPRAELTLTTRRLKRLQEHSENTHLFSGSAPHSVLTSRERQIAEGAARGLSDKEIARRLHLSHRTVSNNLGRIYKKLDLRNRTDLRTWYRSTNPPG